MHSSARRGLMALLFLVGCTPATPPPSGEDAGVAPPDGATPEVDGGSLPPTSDGGPPADPDGGVAPPSRLDGLVLEAAGAVCRALTRCCDDASWTAYFGAIVESDAFERFRARVPPAATLSEAECTAVLGEIFAERPFGDWVDAVHRGEVSLNEAELDACLGELSGAACGADVAARLFDGECLGFGAPGGGASQRRIFERTGGAGAPCGPISDGFGGAFYGTCDPDVAFCCYPAPGSTDCVRYDRAVHDSPVSDSHVERITPRTG